MNERVGITGAPRYWKCPHPRVLAGRASFGCRGVIILRGFTL